MSSIDKQTSHPLPSGRLCPSLDLEVHAAGGRTADQVRWGEHLVCPDGRRREGVFDPAVGDAAEDLTLAVDVLEKKAVVVG